MKSERGDEFRVAGLTYRALELQKVPKHLEQKRLGVALGNVLKDLDA